MGGMYTGKSGQERLAELLDKVTEPTPAEQRDTDLNSARDEGYQSGFSEGRQSFANEVIDALNGIISVSFPITKVAVMQIRTEVMRLAREGSERAA